MGKKRGSKSPRLAAAKAEICRPPSTGLQPADQIATPMARGDQSLQRNVSNLVRTQR